MSISDLDVKTFRTLICDIASHLDRKPEDVLDALLEADLFDNAEPIVSLFIDEGLIN